MPALPTRALDETLIARLESVPDLDPVSPKDLERERPHGFRMVSTKLGLKDSHLLQAHAKRAHPAHDLEADKIEEGEDI